MRIAVPREVKNHEYRVGLTPDNVADLVALGATVAVEQDAGSAIGFMDEEYRAAGAEILSSAAETWAYGEMVVKVKEPQRSEFSYLRDDLILFTYLHLAAEPDLTRALVECGTVAIAYETVSDSRGALPLLKPMSEVAGRMSIQVGVPYLEKSRGGSGVLIGGVPGVAPGRVAILGGGVSGSNAAQMAMGLGAHVTILDRSLERLRQLDDLYGPRLATLAASPSSIARTIAKADLLIGAVLVPGRAAPKLVSRSMIEAMRPGSVVVDIAIDQGGCFATSRPTSHTDPVYQEAGITHYCVTNIPGAVARTATLALTNATLPFVMELAEHGEKALAFDQHLKDGLNVFRGRVTCKPVAEDLGYPYEPV
ncbi:MAG: alanine dehydrogenase [Pseudomonadota bacterium]